MIELPTHVSARNVSALALQGFGDAATSNSCLRTECIELIRPRYWPVSDSQLMSPHGMHRDALACALDDALLPTHVSARNASAHCCTAWPMAIAPNSCLRTECIRDAALPYGLRGAPNSCLRTECIARRFAGDDIAQTPNSCLRTECISKTLQEMSCMYGINIHN